MVIDDDREWCDLLRGSLEEVPFFDVMKPVYSGEDGVNAIEVHKPDMIVLDLVLPVYDGLYIIEYIESMREYRPVLYVVSMVGTDRTNQLIRDRKSVHAYSVKPIHADSARATLKALWAIRTNLKDVSPKEVYINEVAVISKPEPPASLTALIEDYLYQCGIGAANSQAKCLRIGIEMCMRADEGCNLLLMDMYEQIGKTFKPVVSRSAVERRVRVAVELIKEKRTPLFEKHFPSNLMRVTNGVFIVESAGILKRQIQRWGDDSVFVGKNCEVLSRG